MRLGGWALCIVLVELAASPRGEASALWKDGCPAFFPPEGAPTHIPGLKTHGGSASFASFPAIDSPLGPTRVGVAPWLSHVAHVAPADPAAPIDRRPDSVLGVQTFVQLALQSGPLVAVGFGGAAGFGADQASYQHTGNVSAYVGYRHTGYLLGPTFRTGTAIRIGGGNTPFDGNAPALVDERQRLGARSPFRAALFGFDGPFTLALEQRVEMIGCHAPFLDLRIDLSTWQAPMGVRVTDLPITLAGGAYLLPRWVVFGEVGVELRSPTSVLGFSALVRTSLGAEYQPWDHKLHLGLRAGAITGRDATGYDFEITVSWQPPWWGEAVE